MTDAVQSGGWVWRGIGTWWKPGCGMQRGGFSASSEFVVWGTAGRWDRGIGYAPHSVFRHAAARSDKVHIAEKPETVVRWLVPFVPEGGLVVDPFMGSGTTLVVARDSGRRAVGIELEERYCELAVERLQQGTLFGGEALEGVTGRNDASGALAGGSARIGPDEASRGAGGALEGSSSSE